MIEKVNLKDNPVRQLNVLFVRKRWLQRNIALQEENIIKMRNELAEVLEVLET